MQHIGHRPLTDSGNRRHVDEEDVERLIRRRRNNRLHIAYGAVAGLLDAATLAVWSTIQANTAHGPDAPLSTGYATCLALAIVLGIAAIGATATWLIVWNTNTRAAEADRIREYHEERQLRMTREAITVFLRDGDRDTQGAMNAIQGLINDRSGVRNVAQFPRAHS